MRSRSTVFYIAAVILAGSIGVLTLQFDERPDYRLGPQPDGSVSETTNQLGTPAEKRVNVAGRPLAVAVRPDQKPAAVLNTGGGQSNFATRPIVIVNLASGAIVQQFTPGSANASYDGLIYSRDGAHLYFSQDNGRVVITDVGADGALTLKTTITIPTSLGTVNNGGLALSSDEMTLYVVLNQVNKVGIIDLVANRFVGTVDVQNAPKSIVIVGNTAYVTNQGGRPARTGDVTVKSAGTPIVADDQSGASVTVTVSVIDLQTNRFVGTVDVQNAPKSIVIVGNTAYVTNQGGRPARTGDVTAKSAGTPIVAANQSGASVTGTVSVIDLQTNTVVKTITVGLQPTAILADAGLIYVANTNDDSVSVIDGTSNTVMHTERIRAFPHAEFGSSPNGLAITSHNGLAVSLGANNAVALYRWNHNEKHLILEGFVPTGWYPSSVAVADGTGDLPERLIVTNTKGTATGANVPNSGSPAGKNTHTFAASVSIIPMPRPHELAKYSERVAENNGGKRRSHERDEPQPFVARHPIDHVIYVIKENRTYDQVLADVRRAGRDREVVRLCRRELL